MANTDFEHPRLTLVPFLSNESLYVGIDVGKQRHVAGFLSNTLLERHGRFEACPALAFEQSREGFRTLVDRMRSYAAIESCYVLLEHTGHYHRALEQYLQELDIAVYTLHVQTRSKTMLKTDKRDALNLANALYSQLEKGIQVADKLHLVRRTLPPTEAAVQLRGLIRHRYELTNESTQRKNKLTAICDELFPELTQVLKDPNSQTALALREKFPTPHTIATASLIALQQVKVNHRPSDAKLVELQELAAQSIGVKDLNRQRGLLFEQKQLINELWLIQQHLEQLETEICTVVEHCREGKILTSIPGIGPIAAATIIAYIGNIANFENAAALKSYFGWAPTREQTGSSFDRTHLTSKGVRPMRKMMYLIVWTAVNMDCEWAQMYRRLVPLKCSYDERTRKYVGKGKVIGRIAGQIVAMIYALLLTDYETLSRIAPGTEPLEPKLYDPEIHKRHRSGHYQPLKPQKQKQFLVQHAKGSIS
jgi:transposase